MKFVSSASLEMCLCHEKHIFNLSVPQEAKNSNRHQQHQVSHHVQMTTLMLFILFSVKKRLCEIITFDFYYADNYTIF